MKVDLGLKKIFGVYQICCKERCYIGSSTNLWERLQVHRAQLRAGIHHSRFMQRCYNKYGEESFHINIIETGTYSEEVLRDKEYSYIKKYKPVFNSTCPITYEHSEEMKKKISETLKKKYRSGEIVNPRLNAGRKFNLYNFKGDLLYSSVDANFCVNFLKLSNRSVINNSIRKRRFLFRMYYYVIPEDQSLKDCIYEMVEYAKKYKSFLPPICKRLSSGVIEICKSSGTHYIKKKVKESENYLYYSKCNKSYYTFIGLFNSAVSDRNV